MAEYIGGNVYISVREETLTFHQTRHRPSAAELHTRARCWQEKSSLPISVSR